MCEFDENLNPEHKILCDILWLDIAIEYHRESLRFLKWGKVHGQLIYGKLVTDKDILDSTKELRVLKSKIRVLRRSCQA